LAKKVKTERNRDKNRGQTAAETGTNLKLNAIGKKGHAVSSDRRRIKWGQWHEIRGPEEWKDGRKPGRKENGGNILPRRRGHSRKSRKKQSSAHKKTRRIRLYTIRRILKRGNLYSLTILEKVNIARNAIIRPIRQHSIH